MTTVLIQEVQSLNQNYSQNAESIEEAKREALKAGREAACEEALLEITKGVEDCIKTAAQGGRKVRGQFLPRTECCVYKWARDDAEGAKEADDLRQNKFGDYYLTDLLRRQGLIHRLQDWFDEHHQCVAPAATESEVSAGAGASAGAEGEGEPADEEDGEQDGDQPRRGPRPTPPTRAFKVYWNPMRNKEGYFGIFVNWEREDWERVEKRLRSGSKPARAGNKQQRQPRRQNEERGSGPRAGRGNNGPRSGRAPREDRREQRQPQQQQQQQQQQQPQQTANGGPRRLPPRRPNNYSEQNTNVDGVAHSFHPSV